MKTNSIILGLVALLILGLAAYFFLFNSNEYSATQTPPDTSSMSDDTPMPVEPDGGIGDGAESLDDLLADEPEQVIGQSADGTDITAYHYGEGDTELLFVGGTHGGYSGNTVLVAYELMDYLEDNPEVIPENVKVTVIPVLNPDGLEVVYGKTGRIAASDMPTDHSVTTPGRFNGDNVDLNRNFDCQWKAEGTWQSRTVSGGSAPFSEPEARAVRDYVESKDIAGAVVWYSAAGGVYSSSCNNGISTETKTLTNLYAQAAGYDAFDEFDSYEITGDMVNWFAKNDIPAISVLMTDHESSEWNKNVRGIDALLNYYAE